jgi:hypothetical protein
MSLALPYLACMLAAAQYYHVEKHVLPSLQVVEGGAPGLVHQNTDGSSDFGVMQVNTLWVKPIAAANNMSEDHVTARLRDDSCFNIRAAAAILGLYLHETRGDLLQAVGDYHSHTKPLNLAYQAMVQAAARRLIARGAFQDIDATAAPAPQPVRVIRALPMRCPTMRFASVSSLTERADPALHCR